MSQTVVIAARVPTEDAQRFREQAARFGLTASKALGLLAGGALLWERQHAEPEKPALAGP